ncbi:hypothetical protein KI387_001935, partial [Taxus chinensis]
VASKGHSGKRAQEHRPTHGGGYRTTAMVRAAVTRPLPCRAAVSSLKIKRGKKRGKKGETKDTAAKW